MIRATTMLGQTNFLKTMLQSGKVVAASGMGPVTYVFSGANKQLNVTRRG